MSDPKPEDTKPSKIIAVFWWIVFIVPVAFLYISTQSLLMVGILVALRVGLMFVPYFRGVKGTTPKVEVPVVEPPASVITTHNPLTPYKDELVSEWYGLLKLLRIYDKEKEDKYLEAYRKLRGWE